MIIDKLHLPLNFLFKVVLCFGMIAAIAYFGLCIFLFLQQTRFIFFPSSILENTPELFNVAYEEVWLPVPARSGKVEHIHGWWIAGKHPHTNVLLYLHGNGINIGANLNHAYRLYQLGFSVLLIDYRGYGRSGGAFPNENKVYQDAATAWNYLVQHLKISPKDIFIYGHSLGGAIAIDLAVKQPDAAGLIVESSFTSIREVITHRNLFGIFPVDLILTQRFESVKKVPNLRVPVLFIHGTADSTVPSFMSQELYAIAPEPKNLILLPGGGHNNVADLAGVQYLQWVNDFVQQVYTHYK
ncbi:alpha/beta fold hydrolase [Tolypothrix sp. FACHB-123]|uniref:alpha/beta hydrolase n=1 Tax=Tolypothrix sp. FACHB-123 TaxID=2692868 RepID=UPI0016832439|nr:alpha/beta fold hydrolase [Tolypothrix sp. FACHB-123]MBD2356661.1 alpha/beta fold hydrolase [Tolypothrix sp. FACHB-123]